MGFDSLAARLILLGVGIRTALNLTVFVVLDQLKVEVSHTVNELTQLSIIAFLCCHRQRAEEESVSFW